MPRNTTNLSQANNYWSVHRVFIGKDYMQYETTSTQKVAFTDC